ncbi:MAG: hypothetical protein LC750_00315 [Actinobacteria bacterium]|nr:hypothetical protein [Actinomycetota bacterium]
MMALLKPNEPRFMTAEQAAQRKGYRGQAELALRSSLEAFCRERWPEARVCHEMVMGEGRVRADVVAVNPAHIAAFEVKGEYDETTRLLHQVGMYQLCVPEVWMVVPVGRHADDARVLRHLLPSVGLLVGAGTSARNHYEFDGKDFGLVVEAEPTPRPVHVDMMLEMLWRDELAAACDRLRVSRGKKDRRSDMIAGLKALPVAELQEAVCFELRRRDALWRADPPVTVQSLVSAGVHRDG